MSALPTAPASAFPPPYDGTPGSLSRWLDSRAYPRVSPHLVTRATGVRGQTRPDGCVWLVCPVCSACHWRATPSVLECVHCAALPATPVLRHTERDAQATDAPARTVFVRLSQRDGRRLARQARQAQPSTQPQQEKLL